MKTQSHLSSSRIDITALVCLAAWGCGGQLKQAPPAAGEAAVSAIPTSQNNAIERGVREIVAAQFGKKPEEIKLDTPIGDPPLNADDLDLVELVLELEDAFEITIPDERLDGVKGGALRVTPRELSRLVSELKAKSK